MRRLVTPVAALLLLLTPLVARSAPRSEARGDHFRVICHFENDAAARAALKAAEAVWPFAIEFYGAKKGRLEKPLVVNVYRTIADYEAAEEKLTRGAFKRNLAFAHCNTRSAHVALQPPISDAALATLGLPAQTLQLIAHESSHAARFDTMKFHRRHPMWFVDGNAQWIANQASRKLGLSPGAIQDPWEGRAILHVKEIRVRDSLPSIRDVIHDVELGLEFYERYALREVLFSYLRAKHRPLLGKLIAAIRDTGGGSGYEARIAKRIDRLVPGDLATDLDRGFCRYLDGLAPVWEETYRHLGIAYDRWTQMAFPDTNAICWRTRAVGRDRYTVTGRVTIHPGRRAQMNVLLGRSDEGFVSVALIAGYGVTVFDYRSKTSRWIRIGDGKVPDFRLRKTATFRISVDGSRLGVAVNGKAVLETRLGDRDMTGAWGLGAQSGSCGVWEKVEVKPVSGR